MRKKYQITADGRRDLEDELAELKGRRGEIADKIAEARGYGDLSENAEYDAAREEQGIVETRIAEIEDILMNAEDLQLASSDTVALGSTVALKNDAKEVSYTIVGPVEANPLEGRVSNESPIGVELIDKKVGDSATIATPKGEITYKIVQIS